MFRSHRLKIRVGDKNDFPENGHSPKGFRVKLRKSAKTLELGQKEGKTGKDIPTSAKDILRKFRYSLVGISGDKPHLVSRFYKAYRTSDG